VQAHLCPPPASNLYLLKVKSGGISEILELAAFHASRLLWLLEHLKIPVLGRPSALQLLH